MSFSAPGLTLSELCEVAHRYGYAGIEPRMDAGHAHGVEVALSLADRISHRERAERHGVALACLATSLKFADATQNPQQIEDAHLRIDLAGDLGIPALRVFGGGIPTGVSRAQAVEDAAEALTVVADHAAEREVTLCVETHDDWCDPSDVAAVLRQVDHPAIAVNWDIMHPVRMGFATMAEAFHILKPWIRHVHIHDGDMVDGHLLLMPIGTGAIDHRTAITLLRDIGYQGFISGEWINWEPWETHLPRELQTIKQL